jgi:predicted metal-dependent hydrolase
MLSTPALAPPHSGRERPAYQRAAARAIAPRQASFPVPAETPRYWFDGDPYLTHVMNALSLTFPEGERLFIAAVRACRDQLRDRALAAQVRGFLAQESLHRREHDLFNGWLRTLGIEVDAYYREIEQLLGVDEPRSSARVRLAVTCALEHFTAILAEQWLTRSDQRQLAHPNVRALWTWHALEELDHKAVAFDVYQATGGSYLLRVLVMASVSVGFLQKIASLHARLMVADGQVRPSIWARGLWRCWGPRGYFSALLPAYLRYFKPSFHPWDKDDAALIARSEAELGDEFARQWCRPPAS